MQLSLEQTQHFQGDYWECVRRLLEGVYQTENAGDRLAHYRRKVLEVPGADPALIYHSSPLSIARTLARDPDIRVDMDQVGGIMRQLGFD